MLQKDQVDGCGFPIHPTEEGAVPMHFGITRERKIGRGVKGQF